MNDTVNSEVECSFKCLKEQSCVGYNYRAESYKDEKNCQISNKTKDKNGKDGEWTFYLEVNVATVSEIFIYVFQINYYNYVKRPKITGARDQSSKRIFHCMFIQPCEQRRKSLYTDNYIYNSINYSYKSYK